MTKEKKKSFEMKCEKISLKIVDELEKASKVGFYVEQRSLLYPDEKSGEIEPLVRLRCESKDGESDDLILSPFMPIFTLVTMLQGVMYMHPAIMQAIKENQSNAPKPAES